MASLSVSRSPALILLTTSTSARTLFALAMASSFSAAALTSFVISRDGNINNNTKKTRITNIVIVSFHHGTSSFTQIWAMNFIQRTGTNPKDTSMNAFSSPAVRRNCLTISISLRYSNLVTTLREYMMNAMAYQDKQAL